MKPRVMTSWLRAQSALLLAVLGFHVLAIYALHTGLLTRTYQLFVPLITVAEQIVPPTPESVPLAKPKELLRQESPKKAKPQTQALPLAPPVLVREQALPEAPALIAALSQPASPPSINSPMTASAPPPLGQPASGTAVSVSDALPSSPVPTPKVALKVELPRADADYADNPQPAYPPISRRLGEQGRALIRACVRADGSVEKTELRASSGFERLDSIALSTVLRWRFKPGTRGGVPEAMAVIVPMDFKLD